MNGDGRSTIAERITAEAAQAFVPPATVVEAEARLTDLTRQYKLIEAQMAERKPIPGERLPDASYRAYLNWKGRAIAAKAHLESESRQLKAWIKAANIHAALRRANAAGVGEPHSLRGLVSGLHAMLVDVMRTTSWRPTSEQQAVLDVARLRLEAGHLPSAPDETPQRAGA